MEPLSWVPLGALVIGAVSLGLRWHFQHLSAGVADDDLWLRRVEAAGAAQDRRIDDLEQQIVAMQDRIEATERRHDECEQDRIRLRTFIVAEGLTPP